jgi:hypothetical protein
MQRHLVTPSVLLLLLTAACYTWNCILPAADAFAIARTTCLSRQRRSSWNDATSFVSSPYRAVGILLSMSGGSSSNSNNSKGVNRIKNKQLALRQKLEKVRQAKENRQPDDPARSNQSKTQQSSAAASTSLSLDEIRERNDRLRFAELLKKGSAFGGNGIEYLNRQQQDEEIDAFRTFY